METAGRRVPVIAGVAEYTTAMACDLARDCRGIGVDGLMVMPAMVYSAKPAETVTHFRTVARASDLPVMIYNNPPIYKTDVTPEMLAELAACDDHVCIKESSGATRTLRRHSPPAWRSAYPVLRPRRRGRGIGDAGRVGWVSGLSNAFPHEGNRLFELAMAGRFAEARQLYDWFMPLLHLDARADLVQCIKLCEQIMGAWQRAYPTATPAARRCRTRPCRTPDG